MCGQTVLMGFDLIWGGTGSENHLVVSLSEVGTLNSSKHMDTYLACQTLIGLQLIISSELPVNI